MEAFWGFWGVSWSLLGSPGGLLGQKARMFGSSSPSWAPPWGVLGGFGRLVARLGPLVGCFGPLLGHHRLAWVPLGPSWTQWKAQKANTPKIA
eukprot:2739754-Pyramimonas_sp.AAC.1